MNSLFYAKSILNVSLANPALSCENQYNIINRRVDNLVNKRKQRQPTKEFYDQLDVFVNLKVKSIDVFNKAVTIAIKQGFNEIEIGAFLQEYLKDKIPKTTLYRYLQKIEVVPVELLDFLTVPVEQTKQQQDARVFKHVEDPEFNLLMDLAYEEMSELDKCALELAKRFGELGYKKRKIAITILKMLIKRGLKKAGQKLVYDSLPDKYKPLRYGRKKVLIA